MKRENNHSQPRKVQRIVEPQVVSDGAGVRLKRSIASRALDYLDPFLLLDQFRSDDPNDYIAGFPMHPHRGIETVTYMLAGVVQHRDTLGNAGTISAGDVQWMTAGRGIMHEEMPQQREGLLDGFQLWVNLPAKDKMIPPRYQEVPSDQIPEINREDGVKIRVITGTVDGVRGPVTDIVVNPMYLDVSIPPNGVFVQPLELGHTAFAYVFEGEGEFGVTDREEGEAVAHPKLLIFDDGDHVEVRTANHPARFLLVSGKPLYQPIARYGPFVMNTRAEIEQALRDLREGTFV
jgi:redox-sensitive bicupin YhaK (pirin superfamily)